MHNQEVDLLIEALKESNAKECLDNLFLFMENHLESFEYFITATSENSSSFLSVLLETQFQDQYITLYFKIISILIDKSEITKTTSDFYWVKLFAQFEAFNKGFFVFSSFLPVFDVLDEGLKLGKKEESFFEFMFYLSGNETEVKLCWDKLKQFLRSSRLGDSLFAKIIQKLVQLPQFITASQLKLFDFSSQLDSLMFIFQVGKGHTMKFKASEIQFDHFEEIFKKLCLLTSTLSQSFFLNIISFAEKNKIGVLFECLFQADIGKFKMRILDVLLKMLKSKNYADSDFAFSLLMNLSVFGLRDYISYLRLYLDSIHELPEKTVHLLFTIFVSLFYDDLRKDSFVSELLIILKKQINSNNLKFQKIGIEGIFAIIEKYTVPQNIGHISSTPCASQAITSNLTANQMFILELIKFLLISTKSSSSLMSISLPYFVRLLPKLPSELLEFIEEELIDHLKDVLLLDLREDKIRDCIEIFDLSNKSSPIAIVIQDDYGFVLPAFIDLLVQFNIKKYGNLNEIDALIQCSFFISESCQNLKNCIASLLISLINNFGDFEEFSEYVFERFKQLHSLEDVEFNSKNQLTLFKLKSFEHFQFLAVWLDNSKGITEKYVDISNSLPELQIHKNIMFGVFLKEMEICQDLSLTEFFLNALHRAIFLPANSSVMNDGCPLYFSAYLSFFVKLFQNVSFSAIASINITQKALSVFIHFIKSECSSFSNSNSLNSFTENSVPNLACLVFQKIEFALDIVKNIPPLYQEYINILILLKVEKDAVISALKAPFESSFSCTLKEYSHISYSLLSFSSGTSNMDHVLEVLLGFLQSSSKQVQVCAGIFEFLCDMKGISQKDIILEKFTVFTTLMTFSKQINDNTILLNITKQSKKFIEHVNKIIIKIIKERFSDFPIEYVEILKVLQQGTRILQTLCMHIKDSHKSRLPHVASLKKMLEMLVLEVKDLLAQNGCISAFWMGNLKQKNLQGDTLLSQSVMP